MAGTLTVDYSDFKKGVNELLKMDKSKRKDITKIFRESNKQMIQSARGYAGQSQEGVRISRYPSRIHQKGTLRRSVVFRTSKKYRLTYYVLSRAWYSQIVIMGGVSKTIGLKSRGAKAAYLGGIGWRRGTFEGNKKKPFMELAANATQNAVFNQVHIRLSDLINRTWRGS